MEVGRCSVWWIWWMNQNFPSKLYKFLPGHQRNILHYPDGRLCILCWLIPDTFHQVLLSLVQLGVVLVGIDCLVFQKELIIEDSLPIPPYAQHYLLWVKSGLWCGWWWFISLPHDLFHSTLLYSIQFSSPFVVCFKNVMFCYVYVENHMQKYGQEGFLSLTWNWNIEVMNRTTLVQMIFDTWFGWVCWLFSINVLIWFAINFN